MLTKLKDFASTVMWVMLLLFIAVPVILYVKKSVSDEEEMIKILSGGCDGK